MYIWGCIQLYISLIIWYGNAWWNVIEYFHTADLKQSFYVSLWKEWSKTTAHNTHFNRDPRAMLTNDQAERLLVTYFVLLLSPHVSVCLGAVYTT